MIITTSKETFSCCNNHQPVENEETSILKTFASSSFFSIFRMFKPHRYDSIIIKNYSMKTNKYKIQVSDNNNNFIRYLSIYLIL